MVARVQSISEASREEWLSTAKACPYATYFHTPYWYDLIVPGRGHTALSVCFDDGASAIIPIAKVKRMCGLFVDHFSSPGGTYGGWISGSALGEGHVRALAGILLSKKNLTFRVNPFDSSAPSFAKLPLLTSSSTTPLSTPASAPEPARNLPRAVLREEFTHTLDLTLGEEELYRRTSRCHKRGLRRAAGEGVIVERAESWEEWEQYYRLYESSLARWRAGGPELKTRTVYPIEFFRRLYDTGCSHEALWLARKDGKAAAGLLCFYWGKHAVSWHGAAAAEYFDLRPNNIIYWEAIIDALRRGYEIFDFNPSGGYGGVESFKDRFGTARIPAPVLSAKSPLRALVTRARFYLSAR
jgi:hypothetical protein